MNKVLENLKLPEADQNVWVANKEAGVPPYVLSAEIIVALKVALITNRPLLISGAPGSGKTTLAKAVAASQNWSYLKHTLTSRSRLEDLTAEVDQLQRLHDANTAAASNRKLMPDWAYMKPGMFWWGFDSNSALLRGKTPEEVEREIESGFKTPSKPKTLLKDSQGVVVLLDEIDKAEPDLPNDLLEPLDQRSFQLPDGTEIKAPNDFPILVVITTNGERDLPPAFMRRCIHLELKSPNQTDLQKIANFHFEDEEFEKKETIIEMVIRRYDILVNDAKGANRRPPGTSEFLDAIHTCFELEITPDDEIWPKIEQITLKKYFEDE